MLKKLVKKLMQTKAISRLLIKYVLMIHSLCIKAASTMAIVLNDGVHPKHGILKYKEWFLERILEEDVVLDIGCNTGMMVELLAPKARYVYGIEIDKKLVEKAKSTIGHDNISFIHADATQYDFNQCSPISVVTLSNVLEHIEDRDVFLKKLVSNVNWQVDKEKRFLFRVPTIERGWLDVYKKMLEVEWRLDDTHYIEYTLDEFVQELSNANIDITATQVRFGEIYVVGVVK